MSDLKDFLNSVKNKKGQNLYDHLSTIFTKLLLENPKNAYDFFEDYSFEIKANGYDYRKAQDNLKKKHEKYEEIKNYATKTKTLLDKMNIGTEEDPQEPGPCGYVPNFMEEAKWFEWAGIYFGEELTFKIFKSLTKLTISKQLKQVKFWGKIMASKKDYYIAEGISEDAGGDQEPLAPNVELKGTGINKTGYWVTNDIMFDEWIELPIISPEQLNSARKIKYVFTGNLNESVITNPHFPGKEKDLLKAQIVRISHATAIVPKGIWRTVEDDNREIEYIDDENWKFPDFDTLKQKENWVHFTPSILNQARLVHFKPEFAPEADEEVEMKKIVAKDPFEPRLKSIKADKPTNGSETSWNLKVYGENIKYDVLGFTKTQTNYGIIAIKSLNWPGSVTVLNNQTYSSIYVGYGFKANNMVFFPKEPQKIQVEPNDIDEQPEPNFPKEEEKIEDKGDHPGPDELSE